MDVYCKLSSIASWKKRAVENVQSVRWKLWWTVEQIRINKWYLLLYSILKYIKLFFLGYEKTLGRTQAEEEVQKIFSLVDKDNSGFFY